MKKNKHPGDGRAGWRRRARVVGEGAVVAGAAWVEPKVGGALIAVIVYLEFRFGE